MGEAVAVGADAGSTAAFCSDFCRISRLPN